MSAKVVPLRPVAGDPDISFGAEVEFRRLLETLPAAAYTCDREGLITYFNPKAIELWGRAPELKSSVDRFCGSFRLYTKDGAPITHDECWMALTIRNGLSYNGEEIVVERPDGTRLDVLAHANPFRDERGELIGAVNVLVDVSQLKSAQQILVQAGRAKDVFLATLAHELRNPLAPVRNCVELLRRKHGGTAADMDRLFDIMDRQLGHLSRLIDDLMDVSRITSGKLKVHSSAIDVRDIVRLAVETTEPAFCAAGHHLSVTQADGEVTLHGDGGRLSQALANLLHNAAKFTHPGGEISLSSEVSDHKVVLRVADNGIGLDPKDLSEVFGMFSQLGNGQPVAGSAGMGIGLALAKQIVEMHQGTIEVRSAGLGRGSEFIIRLPMPMPMPMPMPERDIAAPDIVKTQEAVHSLRKSRVLVVDDNVDLLESLEALLTLIGVDVWTADTGQRGKEIAEVIRPHLILLDIGLPDLDDGIARAIRATHWGKSTAIVAVSGWSQPSDRARSTEAGFDLHVSKPVGAPELQGIIERFCGITTPNGGTAP
ncbi:ATP-binding protein [Cupriavidus sp. CuC1]|uniref:hybrid sensor histidine kinase/response regulator n=1 Tax=Cupriavidus sp. CuC1 TaxID=3373131 RepID=UPI0037D7B9FD